MALVEKKFVWRKGAYRVLKDSERRGLLTYEEGPDMTAQERFPDVEHVSRTCHRVAEALTHYPITTRYLGVMTLVAVLLEIER